MDVDRLLGGLPAKQARVIRETKIDGLSMAEAAERGGSASPTSRYRSIAGCWRWRKRLAGGA